MAQRKKKAARPASNPFEGLQPIGVVATELGVTERAVHELVRQGTIPRAKPGRYDVREVLRSYCSHMREVAAGREGKSGKANLAEERARLAAMQADGQELKNEVLRGSLVPADEIEAASVAIHSAVQRRLLGVPATCAPLVAVENEPRACEAIIREFIEEALQKVADLDVYETAAEDDAPEQ